MKATTRMCVVVVGSRILGQSTAKDHPARAWENVAHVVREVWLR